MIRQLKVKLLEPLQTFFRSSWTRIGLQTKMSVVTITGLVALTGIFGLLAVAATRSNTGRALQERVILAQVAARHMDYVLGNVQALLQATASQEILSQPDTLAPVRQDALKDVVVQPGSPLTRLWLADPAGNVLAASPPLTAPLSLAGAIPQVLRGEPIAFMGVELPLVGPAVIAAVPVRDASGRVTGALAGALDMSGSEMDALIQSVTLGKTGYVEIVDQRGLVLLSTQPERLLSKADHGESLVSMIDAGQTKATTCHNCHEAEPGVDRQLEVMAFAPLKRAPWGVVVRQSEAEAFDSARQLQVRIVILGFIAIIGATTLVWLVTRSIIDPVKDLTAAADRIAQGDLETSIRAQSRDEIGILAHTLNGMRARLRDSIAEIQSLNRDLDARVQARTQECVNAEAALRVSRDYLQSIIDGLDDTLLVVGPDRIVRQANEAARRRLEGQEIIGRSCSEVSPCPGHCELPNCPCPLPSVLASGQPIRVTHYHPEGDEKARYIEVIASPLRDGEGHVQAMIELMHDITEERELREMLVQRNRELSALNAVSVVSTQPFHLDEFLSAALDKVLQVTNVDAGAIFLLQEDTAELELNAYQGSSEEAAQAMIRLHLDDSACGGVASKDHPMVVPDLTRSRAGAGHSLRLAGLCALVHVPLMARGTTLGTLCVGMRCPRDFNSDEVDLLMAIGSQIALGVENARLYEELARREQLRGELLEKVITAQEEERKRIARDLHDDTSQSLSGLIYSLEAAEATCSDPEAASSLSSMRQIVSQTLEGVHKLIFDLRPSMLDHLGLFVALRWYAETHLEPAGIRLHLEEKGSLRRLPPQTETALFRVVQEAVNNIARHSGARNVHMLFDCQNGNVGIDIEDDGIGFDMIEVAHSTDQRRGLGLVGMQERVGLLGGQIAIASVPGTGTQVSIRVPVEKV